MSFVGCVRISWLNDTTRRILSDAYSFLLADFRNVVRLPAVVLATAALGACAQSVSNKSAFHATGRQMSLAAVNIEKHSPLARHKYVPKDYALASFYADDTETANGEKFDPQALTAAHRTLPFGTKLRVTNVATGHSVVVRVNDRGPFVQGRAVDLSLSAAEKLGIIEQGVAQVRLQVVH
jgi:rare lipoprotein A